MPRLRALLCADAPSVWRAAGFVVDSNNQIDLGTLTIKLVSGNNTAKDVKPKGFTSWVWSGISSLDLDENNGRYSIDGVATHISISEPELNSIKPKEQVQHPNGVTHVDHVVLRSGDLERTKEAFGKIGLPLRREANDIYPGITQLFYRPGDEVIIEVVGFTAASTGTETSSQAPHSFLWGATFTVKDDLTIAKALLQDKLSEIREAKQRGRRIATLRNKELNISAALALMTPHVPKPSSVL